MGLCTGTLLSTAHVDRNFVLTSDHCFSSLRAPDDFQNWVMVFNYQAPCNTTTRNPNISETLQGVRLVYYNSRANLLLLEISDIPFSYQPVYMGFDSTLNFVPTAAVTIQQPNGNIKRISYANGSITDRFAAPIFPTGDVAPTQKTHLKVAWSKGATMTGSSGAPLIDAASGRTVAVLTGGFATCNAAQGAADFFGRLSSEAWSDGLADVLSPSARNLPLIAKLVAAEDVTNAGAIAMALPPRQADRNYTSDTHEAALLPEPTIGALPPVVVVFAGDREQAASFGIWLHEPPAAGETITIRLTLLPLPGNMAAAGSDAATLSVPALSFSSANWANRKVVTVKRTDMQQLPPSGLLRFDVQLNASSDASADYNKTSSVRAIFLGGARGSSGFAGRVPGAAGVAVPSLPFFASSPLASPSGLAVLRLRPAQTLAASLLVCMAPGALRTSLVAHYASGILVGALAADPAASDENCLEIRGEVFAGGAPHALIVSDSAYLGAPLPAALAPALNVGGYPGAGQAGP
ncbi:hypothetical protein WJX81_003021 [Elliptochloris bilobata]|uniref:Peptidase S1 domain-containing protein n=1 Tax=Elliptochloris bilobata TaxID=381761 RepID=A0AAW1RT04_9CHLO